MSSHQQMVNGDIDNCDGARHLAVEAITPQRLGLPVFLRDVAVSCASARGWRALHTLPTGRVAERVGSLAAGKR
ncbi:hypothetical protein DZE36_11450 [Xanthomonas campestris pv. campestris]|nr:hypothetical protein D0A42_18600 [Xanthomonas campestris pv. campestris]RFF74340.1 hypothetical protein DZE36_11450 [Xanthomonas campestris pv. campestris]